MLGPKIPLALKDQQVSLKEQIVAFIVMLGLCLIITGDYLRHYGSHEKIVEGILVPVDYNYYFDRECNKDVISENTTSLELRKQMRWAWKYIEINMYQFINNMYGIRTLSISHKIIYSMFLSIGFLFIVKLNFHLMGKSSKKSFYSIYLLYVLFLFYTLEKYGGEFYFSVIESFCISAALYAVISRNVLLYLFVIILGVINRESGVLIAMFWFLFYPKDYKSYIFGFISPILLILLNLDVAECMFRYDYLLSVTPQSGQMVIWDSTSYSFLSLSETLFRNYIVFLIPVIYLRDYFKTFIARRFLLIFYGYIVVFLLGATLDHMGSKFLLAPILITLCTQALFVDESHRKES